MTREEANKHLHDDWYIENGRLCVDGDKKDAFLEAVGMGIKALRPVSREQVEKVFPGCEKCRNQANWPSWIEKGFVYCPKCGTPLTSWAWEKQVERLETLKDGL